MCIHFNRKTRSRELRKKSHTEHRPQKQSGFVFLSPTAQRWGRCVGFFRLASLDDFLPLSSRARARVGLKALLVLGYSEFFRLFYWDIFPVYSDIFAVCGTFFRCYPQADICYPLGTFTFQVFIFYNWNFSICCVNNRKLVPIC